MKIMRQMQFISNIFLSQRWWRQTAAELRLLLVQYANNSQVEREMRAAFLFRVSRILPPPHRSLGICIGSGPVAWSACSMAVWRSERGPAERHKTITICSEHNLGPPLPGFGWWAPHHGDCQCYSKSNLETRRYGDLHRDNLDHQKYRDSSDQESLSCRRLHLSPKKMTKISRNGYINI